MSEPIRLLQAEIAADEQAIARLYELLAKVWDTLESPERTIVASYYLHNLYVAFEHIFERVAETFENQIADKTQWHAQLLRRMTLDVPAMRPRLIGDDAYECLDELRRFRHVFRSAYTVSLDKDRLQLVIQRAQRLQTLYPDEIAQFQKFLSQLE
jgi:hypothetical protein